MALSMDYSGSHRSLITTSRSLPFTAALRLGGIYRSWISYRERRELESYPIDMMKDVGYPAAGRADER